jgi:hypothetical protein
MISIRRASAGWIMGRIPPELDLIVTPDAVLDFVLAAHFHIGCLIEAPGPPQRREAIWEWDSLALFFCSGASKNSTRRLQAH